MENIFESIGNNDTPIKDELEVKNLKVIGEIPKDLTGIYLRNGPNPVYPSTPYQFAFDGDGMIHAVYLAEGRAHYRNRYVETKALLQERLVGKPLYRSVTSPKSEEGLAIRKNSASMNIIFHAGKYLALFEVIQHMS